MKWNASFRLQAWLVSPLILSLLILSGCTAPAIPDGAWMAPTDVDSPTQPNYLELGWQSFIAFNWPAVTGSGAYPGQPDKNMNITNPAAAKSPTVWLTWMMPEQVFLPQAANPGLWNAPTVALPMKEDPVTGTMLPVIGGMSKFSAGANDDEFDEAFSNNPLIDQRGNYVFYDVRNCHEISVSLLTLVEGANV